MSSKTTTNKTSIHALGECYQGDEYLKRYKAFLAKYQLVEHNLETLGVCLPSAIKTFSFQEDVCKVLSVGAADGELDLQVVKVVKDISKKKVYNRVIEPNEYSLNRYRESITTKLPPELSGDNVIFDLGKPRTFQEYMAEEKMDSVKFDIVHFIQSIYYMDMEEALTHCYNNELGEHGIIICIIDVESVMLEILKRQGILDLPTKERFRTLFKKKGWKYQEYSREDYLDVTEVFDDQSVDGNLLLDFLTHTINFRTVEDETNIQEIMDLIRNDAIVKEEKMMAKIVDYCAIIFK